MFSAESDYVECVKLLTSEIGMCDKDGDTSLMIAAIFGHCESVKLLL